MNYQEIMNRIDSAVMDMGNERANCPQMFGPETAERYAELVSSGMNPAYVGEFFAQEFLEDPDTLADFIGDWTHGDPNRDQILEDLFDKGGTAYAEAVLKILDRQGGLRQ